MMYNPFGCFLLAIGVVGGKLSDSIGRRPDDANIRSCISWVKRTVTCRHTVEFISACVLCYCLVGGWTFTRRRVLSTELDWHWF